MVNLHVIVKVESAMWLHAHLWILAMWLHAHLWILIFGCFAVLDSSFHSSISVEVCTDSSS